jgi:fatty acid desaturase
VIAYTADCGPAMSFLYWNMNYHAEHHMYAAVPFYNLPEFHRVVRHDMAVPQRSFSAALRLLGQIKRKQREDPRYLHVPEFPATAAPPKWR